MVDVLLHASFAVNVLVCERLQLVLCTAPSDDVTVGVLTASVAVAVPSAAFISDAEGLQPNVSVVPVASIVGGVMSIIKVAVADVVLVPHGRLTISVL